MENTFDAAMDFICRNEHAMCTLQKEHTIVRTIYLVLRNGGFDLQELHRNGALRMIVEAFI